MWCKTCGGEVHQGAGGRWFHTGAGKLLDTEAKEVTDKNPNTPDEGR